MSNCSVQVLERTLIQHLDTKAGCVKPVALGTEISADKSQEVLTLEKVSLKVLRCSGSLTGKCQATSHVKPGVSTSEY